MFREASKVKAEAELPDRGKGPAQRQEVTVQCGRCTVGEMSNQRYCKEGFRVKQGLLIAKPECPLKEVSLALSVVGSYLE